MTDSGRVFGSRASTEPQGVSALSGFDPARIDGDIKLMLLATPTDKRAMLMPTGMTLREWEFATESGAYLSVYNRRLDTFGFRLSPMGRKLRAAIAMEAAEPDRPRSGLDPKGNSAGPQDIAPKVQP